jgi:hypothetical protein
VPEFTRKPGTLTSGALCQRLHFPAIVVEDEGTFRVARQMLLPLLFWEVLEHLRKRQHATLLVLNHAAIEANCTGLEVYPIPRQWKNFAIHTSPRIVHPCDWWAEILGKPDEHSLKLPGLKEPLPSVVLLLALLFIVQPISRLADLRSPRLGVGLALTSPSVGHSIAPG